MSSDIYYNEIEIYENDNSEENTMFAGKIYIDGNNYCEGIVKDKLNNQYLIFGFFKKYKHLNLYIIKDRDTVIKYKADKQYIIYGGEYSVIKNDNVLFTKSICIKVSSLEYDPRDNWFDNPKQDFIDSLIKFKQDWLSNVDNKMLFDDINKSIEVNQKRI